MISFKDFLLERMLRKWDRYHKEYGHSTPLDSQFELAIKELLDLSFGRSTDVRLAEANRIMKFEYGLKSGTPFVNLNNKPMTNHIFVRAIKDGVRIHGKCWMIPFGNKLYLCLNEENNPTLITVMTESDLIRTLSLIDVGIINSTQRQLNSLR